MPTYPLGTQPTDAIIAGQPIIEQRKDPVTGAPLQSANVPDVPTSAPAGAPPVSGTPLSGGEPPAGAEPPAQAGPPQIKEKPNEFIAGQIQKNPDAITDLVETSARVANETAKNSDDNAAQLKALSGPEAKKSIEELQKIAMDSLKVANTTGTLPAKHYKKLKSRWRNIFKYIGEDEMGLFLIDFGLRAMMAGDTANTDLGALGQAGMGALGALQGRRQAAVDQQNAMTAQSREMAIDQYKAESERMRAQGALMSGEAAKTRANAPGASGAYAGEKVWMTDFFRKAGWSDQQIADYFSKAKGSAARRQDLTDALLSRISRANSFDKDPDTGKKWSEFGPEDIQNWVDGVLAAEQARTQGALPPPGQPVDGATTADLIREAGE